LKVRIYTDGSAKGNPGPGGYGIVLKYKDQVKEMAQGFRMTTNNRMEMQAVISSLNSVKGDSDLSAYIIRLINDCEEKKINLENLIKTNQKTAEDNKKRKIKNSVILNDIEVFKNDLKIIFS
jgi:ribonuclease HI